MVSDEHAGGCAAGPVTADCPAQCLRGVLPAAAFIPLSRAYMASFEPPRTVGDVVRRHQQGRLPQIRGPGSRRTGEIGLCLVMAGLVTSRVRAARSPAPERS